jgi:hypothetical protein
MMFKQFSPVHQACVIPADLRTYSTPHPDSRPQHGPHFGRYTQADLDRYQVRAVARWNDGKFRCHGEVIPYGQQVYCIIDTKESLWTHYRANGTGDARWIMLRHPVYAWAPLRPPPAVRVMRGEDAGEGRGERLKGRSRSPQSRTPTPFQIIP